MFNTILSLHFTYTRRCPSSLFFFFLSNFHSVRSSFIEYEIRTVVMCAMVRRPQHTHSHTHTQTVRLLGPCVHCALRHCTRALARVHTFMYTKNKFRLSVLLGFVGKEPSQRKMCSSIYQTVSALLRVY